VISPERFSAIQGGLARLEGAGGRQD